MWYNGVVWYGLVWYKYGGVWCGWVRRYGSRYDLLWMLAILAGIIYYLMRTCFEVQGPSSFLGFVPGVVNYGTLLPPAAYTCLYGLEGTTYDMAAHCCEVWRGWCGRRAPNHIRRLSLPMPFVCTLNSICQVVRIEQYFTCLSSLYGLCSRVCCKSMLRVR